MAPDPDVTRLEAEIRELRQLVVKAEAERAEIRTRCWTIEQRMERLEDGVEDTGKRDVAEKSRELERLQQQIRIFEAAEKARLEEVQKETMQREKERAKDARAFWRSVVLVVISAVFAVAGTLTARYLYERATREKAPAVVP